MQRANTTISRWRLTELMILLVRPQVIQFDQENRPWPWYMDMVDMVEMYNMS